MRIIILSFTTLLAGCSTLINDHSVKAPPDNGNNAGIHYFLPKRLHNVTVKVTRPSKGEDKEIEKAFAQLIKAATSQSEATKNLSDKKVELKNAEALSKARPDVPTLVEKVEEAKAAVKIAEQNLEKANNELTAAQSVYDDLKSPKIDDQSNIICNVALEIKPLDLVPDPEESHAATLNHLPWRDDVLKITTTSSGLLSGAEGSSTDRTADILIELAQAVTLFGKGFQPELKSLNVPEIKKEEKCITGIFSSTIDFSRDSDLKSLNKELNNRVTGLEIKVSGWSNKKIVSDYFDNTNKTVQEEIKSGTTDESDPDPFESTCPLGASKDDGSGCNGLFYRRDLPYIVKLIRDDSVIYSTLISMPQLSPIAAVPLDTGGFVKTTYNVTFENGMLKTYDVNRPSELLALVKLPVDMARGIMSILTDFISLRVDYSSKETALAQAEKDRLEAITALQNAIKAQSELPNSQEIQNINQ